MKQILCGSVKPILDLYFDSVKAPENADFIVKQAIEQDAFPPYMNVVKNESFSQRDINR